LQPHCENYKKNSQDLVAEAEKAIKNNQLAEKNRASESSESAQSVVPFDIYKMQCLQDECKDADALCAHDYGCSRDLAKVE
jgi:hypothetical protein